MFDLKKTQTFLYDISTTAAGKAHMLADGPTAADSDKYGEQAALIAKGEREQSFPKDALLVGLRAEVEKGQATRDEDKRRILNTIAGETADLDAPYPIGHASFAELDAQLRALVAVAAWPQAATVDGLVQELGLPALLAADHTRTSLALSLYECKFANEVEIATGLSGLTSLTHLDLNLGDRILVIYSSKRVRSSRS